jgi:hypothetical protein
MKYVYALLIALVCMTGCTARQATTTTFGLIAAGFAGAVGLDGVEAGTLAENFVDLGFEGAEEAKKAKAAKRAEELVNGD